MKIVIPATIEEATSTLTGIDSLLTAKGWERAAIVYAFTKDGISEFAALGITGLTNRETVTRYRQAWIDGKGKTSIKPGDTVTLPTGKFPPSDTDELRERVRIEPGSSDEQVRKAVKTMTTEQRKVAVAEAMIDPDVARTALGKLVEAEPEMVADIVSDDRSAVSAITEKYDEKHPRPKPKARELGALDSIGILTELPIAIDQAESEVDVLLEKAEVFSRLLRKGGIPMAEEVVADTIANIAKVQHKLGVAVALIEDGLASAGKSVEELL